MTTRSKEYWEQCWKSRSITVPKTEGHPLTHAERQSALRRDELFIASKYIGKHSAAIRDKMDELGLSHEGLADTCSAIEALINEPIPNPERK